MATDYFDDGVSQLSSDRRQKTDLFFEADPESFEIFVTFIGEALIVVDGVHRLATSMKRGYKK